MTDDPGLPSRQAPKRQHATIRDLTLLVRVPGRPYDIQAFTDSEAAEAARYARAMHGVVERMPR